MGQSTMSNNDFKLLFLIEKLQYYLSLIAKLEVYHLIYNNVANGHSMTSLMTITKSNK